MRMWKSLALAGLSTLIFSGPAFTYCSGQYSCDGYTDADSHPLRLVAYALHPVGYTLEWLVTRPIHALVSQPELCPLFGYSPERWDCEGAMIPQATEVVTAAPPPAAAAPAGSPADLEAARRAADEARQAADEAKRAAEEAARAADKATKAFEKGLRK